MKKRRTKSAGHSVQDGKHSTFYIPPSPRLWRTSLHSAFSLVELLIVMAVIVILVTMLFAVITSARDKARQKQALTEAHNIVLALKTYRMEFGQWPNQSQAEGDTTYFTNNYQVILPLIGHNPRGKVFLALRLLSISTNTDGATNFFGQTDFSTNFLDPWGVPYVICLNEDMSDSCRIVVSNTVYTNFFSTPPQAKYYFVTNYSVANADAAVASFAGGTTTPFSVETWSEPR